MPQTVLIAIDGSRRELFGCSLLVKYLEAMGIRAVLCSRLTFYDYYHRYVPDAVVWPNAFVDHSTVAQQSYIFVLPAESGNAQADQIVATHGGTDIHPVHSKCVDRFFCWGPEMKEILLGTGKWRDEQLAVTGSPATDHWLLPHSKQKSAESKVGLTTTFRAFSNSYPPRKLNSFQFIDEAELYGGDGTYYRPPEHIESWIFFEASLVRVIASLIRTVVLKDKKPLEIRPHPGHHLARYQYFQNLSDDLISITKKGTITEWLEHIGILFTYVSASALDAVVRGVPVVSLKGLLDQDALRKIPADFRYHYDDMLWQLEDVSQANEYIQLAEKGELHPCRDQKRFGDFMARHFLYPRKCPAAYQIALEIKAVLENGRGRKISSEDRRSARNSKSVKQIARQYMPLLPQAKAFLQYINGLLISDSLDTSFTYQPWRVWECKVAMRVADQVWSSFYFRE